MTAKDAPVLVTGGAGFIGANLCRRLLRDFDCPVICLDNLSTGSLDSIDDLFEHPLFTFVEHDITHPIPEDLGKCRYIFNLAYPNSTAALRRDKENAILTSVVGLRNVLRYAIFSRCETVFHASTGAVYGDPEVTPQRESYPGLVDPAGPLACYEEGKRIAETLCLAYREQCGIKVKIARIFNTYGPGMKNDTGNVIAAFLTQAVTGQPLIVHGDGRQVRTFCYIDDLLDGALRFAMETPGDFTGPLNLGSAEKHSIRDLADIVLEVTGSGSRIENLPHPPNVARVRHPDTSLAERVLGWKPKMRLAEGLGRTADYFRQRLAVAKE